MRGDSFTRADLASEGEIAAAAVALDRCSTDADFAAWARRYARSAVESLAELTRYGTPWDGD